MSMCRADRSLGQAASARGDTVSFGVDVTGGRVSAANVEKVASGGGDDS